mmetsp:Transcript_98459/g.175378  ORF Transcript_98459/g.175378 Transcript_98459/m.175378 type:complete len:92 (+) Transcript_98459:86-361(+)|eukprot:CAMPEP_0197653840 /NCGR_PEP_ID=MMETSP1338-20131121/37362_1 /TAXON_ID=43686 ORGANISM="Pelagodinium beii, Strain RCC1491" /NCGR_SAMPLE_ID=MMETSP1338 /ASSEMBLY_ACC=CAM_ASM_000754 /LENGTH=91 /DNA_ID=CAMNT_0043229099 /DNA_START=77 /DNA_END=352 /DNA_ORIENTATION=-
MAASAVKPVVMAKDMEEGMLSYALDRAAYAMDTYNLEKDIASHLKQCFEQEYTPTWHCMVGRNFSSFVTHEKSCYCYFYIGQMGVLLFKTP